VLVHEEAASISSSDRATFTELRIAEGWSAAIVRKTVE